ncbi:MAG: P-loop ATPase, Sll1717 family [Candidatus Limnocylindrales bacterium]
MPHSKADVADVLGRVDLGSSVAEHDDLLEAARVETSVFSDLMADRVDLVPGTKGSGKSALYRIFVDFLAPALLKDRKVVIAHGVQSHGDSVFLAFQERFETLTEDEFVDFWCVYLVSLAHTQFLKNPALRSYLGGCESEIDAFKRACFAAKIPDVEAPRSLRDVLEWVLNAVQRTKPHAAVTTPDGVKLELGLFGDSSSQMEQEEVAERQLPTYIGAVKETLEAILRKADLALWLMVDRLDEIFPRRSAVETRALRGLLRTLRVFESHQIRVKVFLRDDILDQVTSGTEGFTALTHVTARQAATLSWTEDTILTLVVKRLFTSRALCELVEVEPTRLGASRDYRAESFYRVFPKTVYSPPNQSDTLRWIYSHTIDGRGVVTPRDVIDLLTAAKQRQQDEFREDPLGESTWVIGSGAIRHGLAEMSKLKRDKVLRAELPHLWPYIEKFIGGKTEYSERAILQLLGPRSQATLADLVNIGLLSHSGPRGSSSTYKVPFLYRDGLELTRGRQD